MRKRKWIYVMGPTSYEIYCNKCGGSNITWSEFEKCIWCYDCKVDTPGTGGIFDGPIPLQVSKMLGISFDRFYFKDKSKRKMGIKGHKLIWSKVTSCNKLHKSRSQS
jgi:hypothetical protein